MEGSEPTLVPEWLRCTGRLNQNGAGSSIHHFASSSSQSDALSSINSSRNRSSNKDSPRFTFLDRTTSSNSRHSSSTNGSAKHPYSSFSRSHRDKNREKEKERSTITTKDIWDHDCSDPLGSILSSRVENITLRRSQSLVSRKPSDAIPRKNSGNNFNKSVTNGIMQNNKVSFEKDFPSLGSEEKEIGRAGSPNLSSAVHSLPIGNPSLIGGEGWTSALAEVPAIKGTPNCLGHSSGQQIAIATPVSVGSSSSLAGLNMAEALSQAPARARTTPQVPDKTQRLEELAIKQSRQLIPMTPSMPKPLVVSSSDKLKQPKIAIRISETTQPSKPQTQANQASVRGGGSGGGGGGQIIKNESPKSASSSTSNVGKFQILKPLWENNNNNGLITSNINSTSTTPKDAPPPGPPPTPTPKLSTLEKKHSFSQAQSRTDFFNLMRKKSSSSSLSSANSSSSSLKIIKEEVDSAPVSPTENGGGGDGGGGLENTAAEKEEEEEEEEEEEKEVCVNGGIGKEVYPDEEEAAFLRSLGWEENTGEDEALTEEEINAFIQQYKKLKPTLKVCRGVHLKFEMMGDTCPSGSGISASSEVSFSGSKAEA